MMALSSPFSIAAYCSLAEIVQRVLGHSILADLKVQVGPGGLAGAAHRADGLALGHGVPGVDGGFRQVGVVGLQAVSVGEKHIVAVLAVIAGGGNCAGGGSQDRGVLRGGYV